MVATSVLGARYVIVLPESVEPMEAAIYHQWGNLHVMLAKVGCAVAVVVVVDCLVEVVEAPLPTKVVMHCSEHAASSLLPRDDLA